MFTFKISLGLASVVVYGGLILFSGMLLYHTQRVIRLAETLPKSNDHQYGQPVHAKVGGGGFDPINA